MILIPIVLRTRGSVILCFIKKDVSYTLAGNDSFSIQKTREIKLNLNMFILIKNEKMKKQSGPGSGSTQYFGCCMAL